MLKVDNGFLKRKAAWLLSAVFIVQAALVYGFSRKEFVPDHKPLQSAAQVFGNWTLTHEGVVEDEVQKVLRADDVLSRTYANSRTGFPAHLFVAYFSSQRAGQTPHSPKNCLPGSGWTPSSADVASIPVPGREEPISVNRYVVAKGDSKSLVMYWYQTRDRVVASEYTAKFYVVADAMRYNRTDTALVRVTVPIVRNDIAASERAAIDFVQSFFVPLRQHFPA